MDIYIPTDGGQWVSEKYERLASIIKDYDENLEFGWIPPDKRTREDRKPYVVLYHDPKKPGKTDVVFYASELDTPEDILAKLWLADDKRGDVQSRMDARNAAVEALRLKKLDDDMAEARDKADFLHRSPLNFMKWGKDEHGRPIKMDDQRRRI
jgi:hypothetical protein